MPPNTPIWDDAEWLPLPPLDRDIETDACVVGLGGSGLAAVEALRAHGLRVVGLDAGRVAQAAAGRNGGFLLAGLAEFHHDAVVRWGRPAAVQAYRCTLDELRTLRAVTAGEPEVWWRGSVRLATADGEAEDCEVQYQHMLADGLPVERYAGPEGTGLLFPDDGACNPMRRLRRLARRVIADGAMLHEQTHAVSFSGGTVRTSTGATVHAAHIFVCVDGRLLQCFPHLHPHVRTVRLQMVASAPDVSVHIPRPMYANYAFDYWQQLPDQSVVLGAGRDRFGAAEDTEDDTPTAELQAHLDDLLRRRVGVQTLVTHRWAASVCYTRDYLPIVREVVPGTWAIGAYSGTGNLVGAMCARGAVRRALGVPDPFVDLLTSLAAL